MDQNLRVGIRVESMPFFLEVFAKFRVVKDFAVVHNPYGLILVVNGLIPAGEIENAQSRRGKPHFVIRVDSESIGPAVADQAEHPAKKVLFGFG